MKKNITLSLKDLSLIPMDLPPLKKKNTRLAVTEQLPSRYPHSLEETLFDIAKRGDQTLVFLIKKKRLEQIRKNRGVKAEINCTAQFIPPHRAATYDRAPWICRWSDSDGQDLYFLRGNRLEEVVHIAAGKDISSLTDSFFSRDKPVIFELSKTPVPPLFSVQRRSLMPVIFSCLPPGLISIFLILSFLNNSFLTRELAEQEMNLTLKEKSVITEADDYPWKEVLSLLSTHIPCDHYALLNALYPSFQNRGKILSLTVQGSELLLEAVGKEGLLIMEDLENRGILTSLTLNQIHREKEKEIVSLSGNLKEYDERSLKRELNISYDSASLKKIQEEVINLYQLFDHQTDLYQRGITLREELLNCGLIPTQFREVQSEEGSFLEFTLTGEPENFLTFLENPLSPIRIFYFTLNAQRSSITMGIAPARLPDNISPPPGFANHIVTSAPPAAQRTPRELAALFYRPPVTITPVRVGPQIAPVEQPLLKDRLSYIGRVKTKESGENYGFKEAATGKIILVNLLETVNNQGWALKGEEDERFLLAHENNLYEVNR
jgi:hypothetical protein